MKSPIEPFVFAQKSKSLALLYQFYIYYKAYLDADTVDITLLEKKKNIFQVKLMLDMFVVTFLIIGSAFRP
jgi:hypothetical protein